MRTALRTVARALLRGRRPAPATERPVPHVGRADPVAAWDEVGRSAFRATVELSRCCNLQLNAFRCDPEAPDPLAATLMAITRGQCSGYRGSPLEAFHATWQPKTVAEWYGLDPKVHPPGSPLLRPPPDHGRRLTRKEFAQHRRSGENPRGSLFYGPCNREFGEITIRRALAVRNAIRDEGFRPEVTSLRGIVHVDKGGGWQIYLRGGRHTAAALVSLGAQEATILLGGGMIPEKAVLHRHEARHMQDVQGHLDQSEAEVVFDRLFAFRQQPGCTWRAA